MELSLLHCLSTGVFILWIRELRCNVELPRERANGGTGMLSVFVFAFCNLYSLAEVQMLGLY